MHIQKMRKIFPYGKVIKQLKKKVCSMFIPFPIVTTRIWFKLTFCCFDKILNGSSIHRGL